MKQQIDYLHGKVGAKEWSGNLIYSIESGDVTDPDNMLLKIHGIYLMDIGTSGGTDFEMDEFSTIDMFDKHPELEEGARTGLIHTHHNMNIYFSGVDNSELSDNAENYSPYLSLIVGFKTDYKARVAFVTEIKEKKETIYNFKNISDESVSNQNDSETTKKVVCYYDCKVIVEDTLNDSFIERYEKVVEDKKKVQTITHQNWNRGYGYGHGYNGSWNQGHLGVQQNGQSVPSRFSQYMIMKFCIKMLTKNPKNESKNINSVLQPLKHKYNGNPDDMVDIIDDCMEEVLGTGRYKAMTVTKKYNFLEEVLEYLGDGDYTVASFADRFEGAKVLYDTIKSVILMEEDDEPIGF